jgi:hypothetical protein
VGAPGRADAEHRAHGALGRGEQPQGQGLGAVHRRDHRGGERARPAARKKAKLVDGDRHEVIEGAHPSPLSAKLWFGSKPFSKIQEALARRDLPPIDWHLA